MALSPGVIGAEAGQGDRRGGKMGSDFHLGCDKEFSSRLESAKGMLAAVQKPACLFLFAPLEFHLQLAVLRGLPRPCWCSKEGISPSLSSQLGSQHQCILLCRF